jgi:phosphoribosylformylglycinamidine synthase
MVLKPGCEAAAQAIFEKWELDFAVIGQVTDTDRLVLREHGVVVADIPVPPLVSEAPIYDRPRSQPPKPPALPARSAADDLAVGDALLRLLGSPDLCSRRWIWEQYDHMVMADTAQRPGGDAAVVRVHDTNKALAITTDCTPRYCFADPLQGGRQVVAEAWRNLTAVGARPLAVTDNLNFGNPERPEIMAQLVGCIEGIAEACRALDFPVVSGNVSLYNETNGKAVLPTPAIGAVGVIDEIDTMVGTGFTAEGRSVIVLGETVGHIGASLWLRELGGLEAGAPPPVDLSAERRHGDLVRRLIQDGHISACHDISDGGLLIAVAEMALAGDMGAEIAVPADAPNPPRWLFGEDQARYLVEAASPDTILQRAEEAGVPASVLGKTGGIALTVTGEPPISLNEMRDAHEGWLPRYMANE